VAGGAGRSQLQVGQDAVEHARRAAYMARRSQAHLHLVPSAGHQAETAVERRHLINIGQGNAQLARHPAEDFLRQVEILSLDVLEYGYQVGALVVELSEDGICLLKLDLGHGESTASPYR